MKRKQIIVLISLALVVAVVAVLALRSGGVERTTTIAVATLMSHPALDQVQQQLVSELRNQGYVDGDNVRLVVRNANGQPQLAASIARELASLRPDVTVAITTPMAQAVVKTASGPVVFAAVTDPVGAGIVRNLSVGELSVTGTSDAWPYGDQLRLIRRITPQARRLGVLYNPGEAASQYGLREIRRYAAELGFQIVEGPVASTAEVYAVAQNLVPRVDAILLSSDNTVIAGVPAAVRVAIANRKPLYVGDSGTVEKGGLAAVSVGYAELGTETGKLVARVLRGERNIPTVVARGSDVYLNRRAAELMGISLPPQVLASAEQVYDSIQ